MKRLHNDNMVEGFPSIQTSDVVCVGCLVGKHPEKKYDVGKAHRVVSTLDLIHNDVVGHIPTNSINGCRYFPTFIDDFSRYWWIYFMKLKSEFFETFKSFKAMVENSFNKNIKSIRFDGGGEYVKRYFQKFCENQRGFEWNTQFHTHHNKMVWLRGRTNH